MNGCRHSWGSKAHTRTVSCAKQGVSVALLRGQRACRSPWTEELRRRGKNTHVAPPACLCASTQRHSSGVERSRPVHPPCFTRPGPATLPQPLPGRRQVAPGYTWRAATLGGSALRSRTGCQAERGWWERVPEAPTLALRGHNPTQHWKREADLAANPTLRRRGWISPPPAPHSKGVFAKQWAQIRGDRTALQAGLGCGRMATPNPAQVPPPFLQPIPVPMWDRASLVPTGFKGRLSVCALQPVL